MTPTLDPVQGPPVRVALVGLGGHGRTIRDATGAAGNLEVVAVYDPNDAEASAAADQFGCPAAPSYGALLERDDLEAVVLVTPNHVHRAQAEAAFARGLHVFVEKPIANTVADGRAIIRASEQAARVLAVGHNMRFSRSARLAKEVLAQGRLGEVVTVEVHFSGDNTRSMPREAWRLRPDQCPLLPVMQLGIHALDLVHFLLAPIADVQAFARSVTTQPGVVDSVAATFRTDGGATGTMVSNYCTPVRFEYRISGTEGSLRCTPHHASFQSSASPDGAGPGPPEEHDFSAFGRESYDLQMADFGHAVRQGTAPVSDGWSGLQALAVVEAMAESVERGGPASVPRTHQPAEPHDA